jgi:uncharacterized Tic20 family protein
MAPGGRLLDFALMNEQTQSGEYGVPPSGGKVSEDRTLPVLCHALALAGFTGIPFANVLAPLLLWLWKRGESAAIDEHGKESLNFQLSMTIYTIVAAATLFIFIGIVLLPLILVANLVLIVLGSLDASKGRLYHYPFTIRFLK